ncbi:MAG: hypothetical protein CL612_05370 [Anaerolineaceae bacterium]|jgi:hypothetical protein|nr:hypothetical protein [Anaerolineaceae bacterium]
MTFLKEVTVEELIRNSAISIVYSDENYHRPSFESEVVKLNALIRTLLHNEVDNVRKGLGSGEERAN